MTAVLRPFLDPLPTTWRPQRGQAVWIDDRVVLVRQHAGWVLSCCGRWLRVLAKRHDGRWYRLPLVITDLRPRRVRAAVSVTCAICRRETVRLEATLDGGRALERCLDCLELASRGFCCWQGSWVPDRGRRPAKVIYRTGCFMCFLHKGGTHGCESEGTLQREIAQRSAFHARL